MQSQIVLIVARTKTYVMYPPNVHISIFSNRPITSSNISSSKEMPRLLIYLSSLQRPVFLFVCQVYTLGCIPLQRRTRCLTNTILSSLTAATPYVPVLVRHLFRSWCCKVSNNFAWLFLNYDLLFVLVQLCHHYPAWS